MKKDAHAPGPEIGHQAVDWSIEAGQTDTVLRRLESNLVQRRRKRRRIAALGCALSLLGGAGLWQFAFRVPEIAAPPGTSFARLIRPDEKTLPDGSRIEARSDADLTVAFSAQERRIVLKSGAAHFQVARDVTRPFVVTAGNVEVRALATGFSVTASATLLDVVVTEGRVAVRPAPAGSPSSAPGFPAATLEAGQRLEMNNAVAAGSGASSNPVPVSIASPEMAERLAWRVPRLDFRNTPLSKAVAMFNDSSRVRIHIPETAANQEISGLLRTDSVDAFLVLLANEFELKVDRRTDSDLWLIAR